MRQPNPNPGGELVRPWAEAWRSHIAEQQEAAGIASYGGPLETFNGRDALDDAQAELWDAFMYVSQARMEREMIRVIAQKVRDAVNAGNLFTAQKMVGVLCIQLGVNDATD